LAAELLLDIFGQTINVKFTQSALKRGYTEKALIAVLKNYVYDETLQEDPNKTLVVGFDDKGLLTEMIFNVVSSSRIVVFHAMPCRKVYEDRIGRQK
jgi:hypothetical protein